MVHTDRDTTSAIGTLYETHVYNRWCTSRAKTRGFRSLLRYSILRDQGKLMIQAPRGGEFFCPGVISTVMQWSVTHKRIERSAGRTYLNRGVHPPNIIPCSVLNLTEIPNKRPSTGQLATVLYCTGIRHRKARQKEFPGHIPVLYPFVLFSTASNPLECHLFAYWTTRNQIKH